MAGIWSKLTGDRGVDPFKGVFKPLNPSHRELFAKAVEYCGTGSPVDALTAARRTVAADWQEKFGILPSTQVYWLRSDQTSARLRAKVYRKFTDGKLSAEPVMRMGKVFAELFQGDVEKHTHDDFPDWLHIVLTDWLYRLDDSDNPMKRMLKGGAGAPMPGLTHLVQLCRADDLPDTTWLFYYLDRKAVSISYWGFDRSLALMRKIDGLADFFTAHHDALVKDIAPKLAAGGREQFLKEIAVLDLTTRFAECILDLTVDASKRVRAVAASLLDRLPPKLVRQRLGYYLTEGKVGQRRQAAELIGRSMGVEGRRLLEAAAAKESVKSVVSVIEVALGASAIGVASVEEAEPEVPGWDPPVLDTRVDDAVAERIYGNILKLQERYRDFTPEYSWQKQDKKTVMGLSRSNAADVAAVMNGQKTASRVWQSAFRFMNDGAVFDHPSIELIHVLRLHDTPSKGDQRAYHPLGYGPLRVFLKRQPSKLKDLRALNAVLQHLSWPKGAVAREILNAGWGPSFLLHGLPPEGIWPFFAERIEPLSTALMGQGATQHVSGEVNLDRVLEVLACFPRLPGATRAPLLQLALGETKTYRERAQRLLENLPGIEDQVAAALKSNAQEVRMNAARWLSRLGRPAAAGPIKAALAKEPREPVRATFISALEALGENISDLLHPDQLLKEARKGLKKKMPKGLSWFPLDNLPALSWTDGSAVDAAIPCWWVVLACKLKDPGGNALLLKYLQRLDPDSRQALGMFVMGAFIAQDTRCPTLDEAEAKARQDAPNLLQQWQHWAKYEWGEDFKSRTLEDAHAAIRHEVLGTYLGSAIKEKGVLALCAYCPGSQVVPLLQGYMKDHYTRRHQIEAMLRAVAPGNDSHVIQLLLSVARRYRTRSVQQAAGQLVEQVAERNGWSSEELADRTMPSAGFDASGRMALDYGSRCFTVTLDEKMTPVLTNEKGTRIKSLPAPRQSDDTDRVKEAKSLLSACKKELKQVVGLTTGRFYEAMCAGRRWPAADWCEYLLDHPVAGRLVQRLIWMHEDSDRRTLLRPVEDGTLIDSEDEEVSRPASGTIALAHRTDLSETEAARWRDHLKDYSVQPLFEQLDRPVPADDVDLDQTALTTFQGYTSDTFTLRGTFTKLGYQRGTPEDGGFFYTYSKDFVSLGLRAVMFFTGNCVPEENVPAALEQMGFCPLKSGGWFNEEEMQPLKSVPPILLSEVMADYKAVADKTGGYDPDYKSKTPW